MLIGAPKKYLHFCGIKIWASPEEEGTTTVQSTRESGRPRAAIQDETKLQLESPSVNCSVQNNNTQLFYFDGKSRTIKASRHEDLSLNIQDGGRSNNLTLWKTSSAWF